MNRWLYAFRVWSFVVMAIGGLLTAAFLIVGVVQLVYRVFGETGIALLGFLFLSVAVTLLVMADAIRCKRI